MNKMKSDKNSEALSALRRGYRAWIKGEPLLPPLSSMFPAEASSKELTSEMIEEAWG